MMLFNNSRSGRYQRTLDIDLPGDSVDLELTWADIDGEIFAASGGGHQDWIAENQYWRVLHAWRKRNCQAWQGLTQQVALTFANLQQSPQGKIWRI